MTDYGSDLSAVPDLDESGRWYTGKQVFTEAIVRRLSTQRGALFYDTEYGLDLRELLSDALSSADLFNLSAAISTEVRKDERVLSANATVVPEGSPPGARLRVSLNVRTASGPFPLVLLVENATVRVLNATSS